MAKRKLKIGDSEPVEIDTKDAGEAAAVDAGDEAPTIHCGLVYKRFDAKTEVEEGERAVIATINTSSIDRDREVVLASGGDFEAFRQNPVVLFAHKYFEPPVGRAAWIKPSRDKIIAKTIIAPGQRGDEILALMQGGFLKAFSIGFDPTPGKSGPPSPAEIKKNPDWAECRNIHRQWKLLEYSIVTVPANPEALTMAVSKGMVKISRELANSLGVELPRPRTISVAARKRVGFSVDRVHSKPLQIIKTKPKRVVTALPDRVEVVTETQLAAMVEQRIKMHLGKSN